MKTKKRDVYWKKKQSKDIKDMFKYICTCQKFCRVQKSC